MRPVRLNRAWMSPRWGKNWGLNPGGWEGGAGSRQAWGRSSVVRCSAWHHAYSDVGKPHTVNLVTQTDS